MIDYNYENYYFGGIQEAPMGNPLLFPLTQRDIDKMAKTIKDEPVSITIDKNGTYVINSADYGVDGLSSVDIVVDVPSAPSATKFYYSNGFMSESDDTTITVNSYSQESDLLSVVIGDSVTSIGSSAFTDCGSLASIEIPNSVTSIGEMAFAGCELLDSVIIGSGVTSIEDSAFINCDSLNSVTINSNYFMSTNPEMSTIFGEQVAEYIIGGSVTSIGNFAFEGCTSLASVTIGDSVTSIGNSAFEGCASLASVTIGDSVTSVGNSAFYSCTSLESVTIGNSVTSIGEGTFAGCSSLTSVTIPNSVTSIGVGAFDYTDEIILESNTPISLDGGYYVIKAFGSIESGSGSGSGGGRELKIYVPMEAFDNYYNSTDPGWVYYRDCLVGYN